MITFALCVLCTHLKLYEQNCVQNSFKMLIHDFNKEKYTPNCKTRHLATAHQSQTATHQYS